MYEYEKTRTGESSYRDDFLISIAFTWWWVILYLAYLKVHFMLKKILVRFKIANIAHALPVPAHRQIGRPISHRNEWSFRVYMVQLRNFVPEWNSRFGTTTGVKSHRGDSRRHDILWWYLVNKYRAMRGNRSELALTRKSPWCHDCKHPWSVMALWTTISVDLNGTT